MATSVTLLGQAVEVSGWTLIVMAKCNCTRTGLVQLVVSQTLIGRGVAPMPCPSCGRALMVENLTMTPDGQLQFGISVGAQPQPALVS